MNKLPKRALAHAVTEDIGLAVEEIRAPDSIGPIIVVGQTAQAGLYPANNDGEALPTRADGTDIRNTDAIRTFPAKPSGRIPVVASRLSGARIVVDHGIDIPAAYENRQSRPAHFFKAFRLGEVRLCNDPDAKTFCLNESGNKAYRKGRVVDVGVGRDKKEIKRIPPAPGHILTRHGKEGMYTDS